MGAESLPRSQASSTTPVVLKQQPKGSTPFTQLTKVCALIGPQYRPSYKTIATKPFKVRVELAGEAFETLEYFEKAKAALNASSGLAKQWFSANIPSAVPKGSKKRAKV